MTVSSASATPLTSLAGVSTVPISMLHQQLLVQAGTGGVRQLLFPLNFSAARGGASPRYIQVRQVTMSGQPGVISFPTRFGTPITMRAVPHATVSVTQPGQPVQQEQITTTPVVMPTSKQTPVSTGGDVVISSETPNPTQVSQPPSSSGGRLWRSIILNCLQYFYSLACAKPSIRWIWTSKGSSYYRWIHLNNERTRIDKSSGSVVGYQIGSGSCRFRSYIHDSQRPEVGANREQS